jgi:O-antigen ligase
MISYSGLLVGLIIMTQTRAAWVGTFLIVATYAACINRRYLFVVLLLPLLIFVPSVSHRLADLERGTAYTGAIGSRADELNSFAWRQLMWKSAFIDVAETPFFGKGLASFAPNSLKFFPAAGTSKSDQRGLGAHSAFVQAFYETGAVGFVCYFVIFITLFFRILRHFKDDPRGAIMLASTILAYMMANFSDNMFDYGTANLYFWGFVGIVFAKWAQQRNWAQQQSVFSFSPSRLAYPYRVPAKTISLS